MNRFYMNNGNALAAQVGQKVYKELNQPVEEISKGAIQFFGRLIEEIGKKIEPEKIGKSVSGIINGIFKSLDFEAISGELGDKLSKGFLKFFEKFDFKPIGAKLGNAVGGGIFEYAVPVGNAIGKGLGHLAKKVALNTLPYIFVGSVVTVGTPFMVSYLYYKAKHQIGRPKLATEVRKITIFTPLIESINRTLGEIFGQMDKTVNPIFKKDITRRIKQISTSTKNIQKNKGYFQNVLLEGPGGVGKTMIAKKIARDSNMNYVMMSGGDLAQYIARGEHVSELNKLMGSIHSPTVLFIDEAEGLCMNRDQLKGEPQRMELLNTFLNHTGTESKKIMIILATNRKQDIDPAILDRMDHKIAIGLPEIGEREKIIQSYIPKFFIPIEQKDFFGKDKVKAIAQKTEGFSGRALFKLLNDIFIQKAATDDNKLTQEIIDQSIKDLA